MSNGNDSRPFFRTVLEGREDKAGRCSMSFFGFRVRVRCGRICRNDIHPVRAAADGSSAGEKKRIRRLCR